MLKDESLHVIKGSRLDTWMMLNFPKMVLADEQNRLRDKKTAMQSKLNGIRCLLWFLAGISSVIWGISYPLKWKTVGPISMACYLVIFLIIVGLLIFERIACKRYDKNITKIDRLLKRMVNWSDDNG